MKLRNIYLILTSITVFFSTEYASALKGLIRSFLITIAVSIALMGCWDSKIEDIAPSTKTCQRDYLVKLPEGKQRDTLVEKCMTGGTYQSPNPRTF